METNTRGFKFVFVALDQNMLFGTQTEKFSLVNFSEKGTLSPDLQEG